MYWNNKIANQPRFFFDSKAIKFKSIEFSSTLYDVDDEDYSLSFLKVCAQRTNLFGEFYRIVASRV